MDALDPWEVEGKNGNGIKKEWFFFHSFFFMEEKVNFQFHKSGKQSRQLAPQRSLYLDRLLIFTSFDLAETWNRQLLLR